MADQQHSTHLIGKRLAEARADAGLSRRRLSETLRRKLGEKSRIVEDRVVWDGPRTGASEANLRLIEKGETRRPDRRLLDEAAKILGVNPRWLRGEVGDRLKTLQDAAAWNETLQQVEESTDRDGFRFPPWVDRLTEELARAGWEVPWVTWEVKAAFTQLVVEVLQTGEDYPAGVEGRVWGVAEDLAWLLVLPLRSWGFQPPSQGRWLRDVLIAQIHALSIALPHEGRPFDFDELEASTLRRLRTYDEGSSR